MRNRKCIFVVVFFHNVDAVRTRSHSRRDGAAQEWRQRQREAQQWRDTVVIGEEVRSRAHGRVAQGQWRKQWQTLNIDDFFFPRTFNDCNDCNGSGSRSTRRQYEWRIALQQNSEVARGLQKRSAARIFFEAVLSTPTSRTVFVFVDIRNYVPFQTSQGTSSIDQRFVRTCAAQNGPRTRQTNTHAIRAAPARRSSCAHVCACAHVRFVWRIVRILQQLCTRWPTST